MKSLYIHPGDSSAGSLRESDLAGDVIVWTDLLHEGPVPSLDDEDEFLRLRAEFLSSITGGGVSVQGAYDRFQTANKALASFTDYDETVFWFDACLFDMCILMRHFAWLTQQEASEHNIGLVLIDSFPGVEPFHGLGQLRPELLASCIEQRVPVTPQMTDYATLMWNAFRADDPATLAELATTDTPVPLPLLRVAMRRFLEEYPSTKNGLGRLQQEILEALAQGECSAIELFVRLMEVEVPAYYGDTTVFAYVNALARAKTPLVQIDGPGPLPCWDPADLKRWTLRLSAMGEAVLSGEEDAIALNGIDFWRGGVHLKNESLWRYQDGSLIRG